MSEYDQEPAIATQVTLETLSGDEWTPHPAVIFDLTRQELWISIDRNVGRPLDPGRQVRLALDHPNRERQTADTIVLWHLGKTGKIVVLKRPRLWDPPSRRQHARVQLTIPVYLKADDGESIPSMSTNLSVGGAFCISPMPLKIAQRIDVSLQLTPTRYFDCEAEVSRIDPDPDDVTGNGRLVGLHFLGVDGQRQVSLGQALTRLAQDVDDHFVPRPWRPGEPDEEKPIDELDDESGEVQVVVERFALLEADAELQDEPDLQEMIG